MIRNKLGIVLLLLLALGMTSVVSAQDNTTVSTVYDVIEIRSEGTTVANLLTVGLDTNGSVRPACALVSDDAQLQSMTGAAISAATYDEMTRSLVMAGGAEMQMMTNSDELPSFDLGMPNNALVLPIGFTGTVTLANGVMADIFTGRLQLATDTPMVCGMHLSDGMYNLVSEDEFTVYGAISDTDAIDASSMTFEAVYGPFDAAWIEEVDMFRFRLGQIPRPEGIDSFLIPLDSMMATAMTMSSDFDMSVAAGTGVVVVGAADGSSNGSGNGAANGSGDGTSNGTGNGSSDGGGLIDVDVNVGDGTGNGSSDGGSLIDVDVTAGDGTGNGSSDGGSLIDVDANVGDGSGDGSGDGGGSLIDVDANVGDGSGDGSGDGDGGLIDVDANANANRGGNETSGLLALNVAAMTTDSNGDGLLDVDVETSDFDSGDTENNLLATNVLLDVQNDESLLDANVDLADNNDANPGGDNSGVTVGGDNTGVNVDATVGGDNDGVNVDANVGGDGGLNIDANVDVNNDDDNDDDGSLIDIDVDSDNDDDGGGLLNLGG